MDDMPILEPMSPIRDGEILVQIPANLPLLPDVIAASGTDNNQTGKGRKRKLEPIKDYFPRPLAGDKPELNRKLPEEEFNGAGWECTSAAQATSGRYHGFLFKKL